nr:MAG TPA: hypothetical protein [Caudoviricetes sp.]
MSLPRGNKVPDKRIPPTKKPLCSERFFHFFNFKKTQLFCGFFGRRSALAGRTFAAGFLGGSSALLGAAGSGRLAGRRLAVVRKLSYGQRPEILVLTHRAAGIFPQIVGSFFDCIFIIFNHN